MTYIHMTPNKKKRSFSYFLERGLVGEIDFCCSYLYNLDAKDIPYRVKANILQTLKKHYFIHLNIKSCLVEWTKDK